MNWRHTLAILVNLASVFVPLGVLIARYGLSQPVALNGPDAMKHLAALGGSVVFATAMSLLSVVLLRRDASPTLISIVNSVLRDFHGAGSRSEGHERQAA